MAFHCALQHAIVGFIGTKFKAAARNDPLGVLPERIGIRGNLARPEIELFSKYSREFRVQGLGNQQMRSPIERKLEHLFSACRHRVAPK